MNAHRVFLLAAFASASGVTACADDSIPIPSGPTSYRLTFTTTDERNPLRTVSATIDWNNNLFMAGMNGRDGSLSLLRDGNTWHLPSGEQPTFPFTLQQPFFADLGRVEDDLYINGLSLQPKDGGCAGSVSGGVSYDFGGGDVRTTYEVRTSFDCVVDIVGPAFGTGEKTFNPLDLRYIGVDEYVGPSVTASLVDVAGNTMTLAPTGAAESPHGTSRLNVVATLAFGSEYTLVASGTDLVGNSGTSSMKITTDPDPGLFAQDGFEGPIYATMTSVKVVEAPAMAVPTGKKALAFNKTWSGQAYDRFTARLQAPPGATAVKVTYVRFRTKAPATSSTYESYIVWTVGVPNTPAVAVYDKDKPPVTAEPRPWEIDPAVQGASGWFSQPQTLSFPLPVPATGGEVLFDVFSGHFTATFDGDAGFLLDDLRVE